MSDKKIRAEEILKKHLSTLTNDPMRGTVILENSELLVVGILEAMEDYAKKKSRLNSKMRIGLKLIAQHCKNIENDAENELGAILSIARACINEEKVKCECGKEKHPEASLCKECIDDAFVFNKP